MANQSFLRSVGIFSRVPAADLEPLNSKLRRRNYQRGEVIFHQDDPGDRLHFVAEGMVKISIVSRDGRENDIALLSPGDCFGEMTVLDGGPRSATAIAVDPTETMSLSRDDFLGFLDSHTQLSIQIIALLVRRLRNMDQLVGELVFLAVPTRVAKKLLELSEMYRDASSDSPNVTVPMGQEELSRLVGASRETVSRALTTYRKARNPDHVPPPDNLNQH